MYYNFILENIYFDFIDIFQMYGIKPYLATNANKSSTVSAFSCLVLQDSR